MRFENVFSQISNGFWHDFVIKIWCVVLTDLIFWSSLFLLLQNGGSWKKTVFYISKHTFHFFRFLFFFWKNVKKTTENFTSQKSRKMTPGGPQKTPKILKKWSQNRQKSRKMPKKSIFWGIDFLMIFWMAKKSKKGSTTISDNSVLLALGSTGGL